MKQGVNPTAAQKRWIANEGLNPKEWLVVSWTKARATLKHKTTGETKELVFLE